MNLTDVYTKTYEATRQTSRFVSSCGGTRSGKTISILQLMYFIIAAESNAGLPKTVNSVVSETMPHLRRGAIRDFKIYLAEYLDMERWSEGSYTYTFPNGSILEFFSADSASKVHGPARDRLFLNEGQNMKWETVRQLLVRTRKTVWIDYNPTHEFWVHTKIESRDTCVKINSTYLDNKDRETGEWMLSDEQIAEIESNKDDKYWWRVYGEGKVGQLEGLIFPDFEQVDDLPNPEERPDGMVEAYGLDFGFTNDPSVLIHVLVDTRSRVIWADEVFYRTGMLNSDMAAAMKEAGVGRKTVYADAAEPKTIEELRRYGFNVRPCYKATRKAEQLQAMKGYRQKITKRSLNLIREHRGYTWQRDKDGSYLNEPVAVQDHAEDGFRYGCFPALKAYRESRRIISLT
jgi:phage terminase large subunit